MSDELRAADAELVSRLEHLVELCDRYNEAFRSWAGGNEDQIAELLALADSLVAAAAVARQLLDLLHPPG